MFVVVLKVTDIVGNWDVDEKTVIVNDVTPPSASAGPDQTIDEDTLASFNASGCLDNVGIVNYTWMLTDRAPVELFGIEQTYMFNDPGIYIVTLNVTDASGHWATDTLTVTVNDITAPVGDAGPDHTIDEDTPAFFNASASLDNVGIVNWTWTFTDAGPMTLHGEVQKYLFENPGIFQVTLNVTDAAGNWAIDTMSVTVNDTTPPVANAGPDRNVDEGTLVTYNGSGSSDNVGIVNYTWTFLDGVPVTLSGVEPKYKFDNPGLFEVTLNVMDAAGNRGTDTMTVTVKDITPPVADAGLNRTVPVGSAVAMNGSLSSDNVGIGKYAWNFTYGGKTKSLEGKAVSFNFDKGGVYEVVLTVVDMAGNSQSDTVVITVVDTGRVSGTVLDGNKAPVEGATVEMTASNGLTCTTKTAANGTFSLQIYYGPFTWNISKKGYHKISGNFSVEAMKEARLDLSDHPLKKEEEKGPSGMSLMPVMLIAIVIFAVTAGGYVFMKRKRIPPKENE